MMKENLIPYFANSRGKIGIKSLAGRLQNNRLPGGNYINNTCLHNKYFDLQNSNSEYIGEGSSGVVRHGTYVGKGGHGAFKLFLSDVNKPDLMELKYAIELNKIIPEAVVHIELVKKCDLFRGAEGDLFRGAEGDKSRLL